MASLIEDLQACGLFGQAYSLLSLRPSLWPAFSPASSSVFEFSPALGLLACVPFCLVWRTCVPFIRHRHLRYFPYDRLWLCPASIRTHSATFYFFFLFLSSSVLAARGVSIYLNIWVLCGSVDSLGRSLLSSLRNFIFHWRLADWFYVLSSTLV